jgi:His/Glu/Gln/Arg/opine family amino acid ABC transporter permease subunit
VAGAARRRNGLKMAPSQAAPAATRTRWRDSGALIASTLITAAILWLVVRAIKWDFITGLDFAALWKYRAAFVDGTLRTLLLTGTSVAIGLSLGLTLAILLQLPVAPLRWLVRAYIEVLRNLPLLVLLFWIHFALPVVTGISTSAYETGFMAMSLQSSAYLADVARAGIQAVPKGQWEAADALGLSARTKWTEIILPQALRIVIPPLANIAVGYFKASASLVVLSVGELMTVAHRIATYSHQPIETFTVVGLVYLVLGFTFTTATYRLETTLKGGERI